jgi:hypothetical protein
MPKKSGKSGKVQVVRGSKVSMDSYGPKPKKKKASKKKKLNPSNYQAYRKK